MSGRLRMVGTGLDLSIGALVVYGGHGVGRVTGRKPSTGDDSDGVTIVLEFSSGLSVILPLERAESCLRAPADARAFDEVGAVLRSRNPTIDQSWQSRTRASREKIAVGDPVGLAEVVRDAVERQHRGARSTLSTAEQLLYRKARSLLADEFAAATAVDELQAEAWIDAQLGQDGE